MISRFRFPLLACFVLLGCGDSVGANFAWRTDEPNWVVRLKFGDTHVCTGIVLSEHWLLTAGHCVEPASDGKIKVSQEIFDVGRTLYDGSAELILHPEYTDRSRILTHRWHDVGLIRLEGAGLDLEGRGRLCGEVSTPETLFYGDETIYGVGYGRMPLTDGGLCSAEFGSMKRYDGFVFRKFNGPLIDGARFVELDGRKDALCDGDSGAPLMFDLDGDPCAFAVFSGENFGRLVFYGTLVAPKIQWVESASAGTEVPLDCVDLGNDVWECFE